MKRKFVFLLAAGVVIIAVAAVFSIARIVNSLDSPLTLSQPIDFEVDRGESPRSVARRLQEQGVVRSAMLLLVLARWHEADREIRYGLHRFEGEMTTHDVLDELLRVPRPTVRITIPEGSTWSDIAQLLEREQIVEAAAYREAVCDADLLTALAVPEQANCAEGYLFPDTYNLAPDMTAAAIVNLQVRHFDRVIDDLLDDLSTDTHNAILSSDATGDRHWREDPAERASVVADAVTLASIIEKEAKLGEERPTISSVFHNRLRRGIRLQADPTVIYGLLASGQPWDGTRLAEHLRKPGPYNTYTNTGLPPGPICNPGRGALRAALAPADTKYLYFVARGDGSHEFSATLAQHNRAVARLRRR